MINLHAFWKGRDVTYAAELTDEIKANAQETVDKANELLEAAGFKSIDTVNSGWRPQGINDATSNAATHSKHLTGQACDLPDVGGVLRSWAVDNLDILAQIGLWIESPQYTPTWLHIQTVPPKSGRRVFIPNSSPPTDPNFPITWA